MSTGGYDGSGASCCRVDVRLAFHGWPSLLAVTWAARTGRLSIRSHQRPEPRLWSGPHRCELAAYRHAPPAVIDRSAT